MTTNLSAKSLLLGATALTVLSVAVFATLVWRQDTSAPIGRPALSATPYVPVAVEAPAVKSTTWEAPAPLPRGRDWIYDVFTPPEIFYNARTRQFAVMAPAPVGDETPEGPFGLELVSVRPEPFRLQLIGYVGAGSDARGVFENRRSGEIFLGSTGFRVADLALSIKRFGVRSESVAIPDSMSFLQPVATAVITDVRTGRDITLSQRERRFTGNTFALVALAGESAPREVLPGDMIKAGGATFRIEKITLEPAAIDVVKTAPDLTAPVQRTLPIRFDPTDATTVAP